MIKDTLKKLEQVQKDYLMIGYHFEAISSITNYPDMYELGKKSIHMRCRSCDMTPKHYIDAEMIKDTGYCFKCDELSQEYYHDCINEAHSQMEALGLDPENPDDVQDFMDSF
jgi:hypothetical protein